MYPYRSHPAHQLLPVAILLLGALLVGLFPSWWMIMAFFVIVLIAAATGLWIAIAGTLEKYTDYWQEVGNDIRKLQSTPPELWGAIGFIVPAQEVTVKREVTGEPGESIYYAQKTFQLSLSPEQMQVFADGILSGAKTLAESDWVNTHVGASNARKVKQQMFQHGLIEQKNPRNHLDGFVLTQAGYAYLMAYASDWVQANPNVKVLAPANYPPALGGDQYSLQG